MTDQSCLLILTAVTAAGAFLAAAGTFLAARGAYRGAEATRKASQGQLVLTLHNEYFSKEYLDAVNVVHDWKFKYKDEYTKKFGKMKKIRAALSSKEKKDLDRVDNARRLIKAYFRKAQQLYFLRYLSKKDLTELLCPSHRVELLIELIEPFEPEINPDYKREMYDFFRGLEGD